MTNTSSSKISFCDTKKANDYLHGISLTYSTHKVFTDHYEYSTDTLKQAVTVTEK